MHIQHITEYYFVTGSDNRKLNHTKHLLLHGIAFFFIQSFSYFALPIILQLVRQINLKNVHTKTEITLYKTFMIHFSVIVLLTSYQTFLRWSYCDWLLFLFQLILIVRDSTFNALWLLNLQNAKLIVADCCWDQYLEGYTVFHWGSAEFVRTHSENHAPMIKF